MGSGHKSENDMYLGQMFKSPVNFDAEGNLMPLDEDSIVDENAEFEDLEEQDWDYFGELIIFKHNFITH